MGEIAAIRFPAGEPAWTLRNGECFPAKREQEKQLVCASGENYYTETIKGEHPEDVAQEVYQWGTDLETLRPVIRDLLLADLRKLNSRVVCIFVRGYWSIGDTKTTLAEMVASVLGFGPKMVNLMSMYGPFWPSLFEQNLDNFSAGGDWPPGLKRYGITPSGKIINPLPPVCDRHGMRHFNRNCPPMDFGEWVDKHDQPAA